MTIETVRNSCTSVTSRDGQSGITLVEVLVVLALVGIISGTIALGAGAFNRPENVKLEAERLAASLDIASIYALTYGHPFKIELGRHNYRFLSRINGEWVPHTLSTLTAIHKLPEGLELAYENKGPVTNGSEFIVGTRLIPQQFKKLGLLISARQSRWLVRYDGFKAVALRATIKDAT